MAKKKETPAVASMNPDEMSSAGLMDDFDGTIDKVRLTAWDYDGKIEHHVLTAAVTITPDDEADGETFVQNYSAGDLDHFIPSADGENPTDLDSDDPEDWEGIFALRVGRREQLNNNTNWAHFIRAIIDAGFDTDDLSPSVDCFEGIHAHFNRVPQVKRSGILVEEEDGQPKRANDILVVTEILAVAKKKTKVKSKSKAKAKADTDDADADLVAVVVAAIEASEGEIAKGKLAAAVVKSKAFTGKAKAEAIKRVVDPDFLASRDEWVFDADDGVLYAV